MDKFLSSHPTSFTCRIRSSFILVCVFSYFVAFSSISSLGSLLASSASFECSWPRLLWTSSNGVRGLVSLTLGFLAEYMEEGRRHWIHQRRRKNLQTTRNKWDPHGGQMADSMVGVGWGLGCRDRKEASPLRA